MKVLKYLILGIFTLIDKIKFLESVLNIWASLQNPYITQMQ